MASLLTHAINANWDGCHAMLDRGKGDVNKLDQVRSAITLAPARRHSYISSSPLVERGVFDATPARTCSTVALPPHPLWPVIHLPTQR
jgi:hypothetical protein